MPVSAIEFPSRRSCLSVPGSSERMLAKAATQPADELVLDLEDAVTPAGKDAARAQVVAALASFGNRTVSVRVNTIGTPWCHDDVIALASAAVRPASLIVPKVERASDLHFVDLLLRGVEARHALPPLRLQALVESAAGLEHLPAIAAATDRLDALILGYADLAGSLGRDIDADPLVWAASQHEVLRTARAHGLQAIDGPYFATRDVEGVATAAARARRLGFDGKWAIHPAQLEAVNAAFTPAEAEEQEARAVLAALDEADAGAVALDGVMIDEAMRSGAVRTLRRAEAARTQRPPSPGSPPQQR